ncbi:DUF4143 domain-containing protein, partial [Arthrospira platensis SPKY1]|nr:DUF4143 domain-containing protein [Arthrospira platensis SPKY1]
MGLASWLVGVRDAGTLQTHAARGALFETWVVSELLKQRHNQGAPNDLHFWRDSEGTEVDVLIERPEGLAPVEIKSGSTWAADWVHGLNKWAEYAKKNDSAILPAQVIYGGN